MPPIKKIIRKVIDLHAAVHADHHRRRDAQQVQHVQHVQHARDAQHASDASGDDASASHEASGKARIKALLHGSIDGSKRVRALDGVDKEARRQAILDAAERLFTERHDLANVADVAEAAGLAKGTVYLYFETKEEIYLALHARHVEHFFSTLIERLSNNAPFFYAEMHALAKAHLLDAPSYMPLGACCMGFAANAVPLAAAMQFQMQMTTWLVTAGAGLERHFPKLAPTEGVRLLKHSYALMIGLYSLRGEKSATDPKCPQLPGMGTYQEEASLALTRYWAQVTGISEATLTTQTTQTPQTPHTTPTTPTTPTAKV